MSKKDKNCAPCAKKTSIGGQALIEGIMMRGPEVSAMAVRDPDGEIVLEKWQTQARFKAKFFKLPFIRGAFNFIDSMISGYKCLMRSAEIAGLEDEVEEKPKKDKKIKKAEAAAVGADVETEATHTEAPVTESIDVEINETTEKLDAKEKKSSGALMAVISVVSLVLGLGLSIILFIFLPSQLYAWLSIPFPKLEESRFLQSLFEGILRIVIFISYMALVSLMKDIRRTYMYHGAEHKTIFCYEKGLPLTVENVRAQSRFHPRCGTSFMILMLIVGVFLGMLIPIKEPILRTAIKLAMLPLTMGIGYELIRLAGRVDNLFTRIISKPGVWLQHLTTIEPDDSMIECAIMAFKEVIPEDDRDNW